MTTISEELSSVIAQLPPRDQERGLSFARELARPHAFPHSPLPPGSPPDALLKIQLDPELGEAMERALADCERIDEDE